MKQVWRLGLVIVAAHVLLFATGALAQLDPMKDNHDGAFGMSRSVALGETAACLMMPPVLVSGPFVESAKWSADGKYVALVRNTARIDTGQILALMKAGHSADMPSLAQADLGDTELLVYSLQGKLFSVWKADMIFGQVVEYGWLTGNTLVAVTQAQDHGKTLFTPIVVRIAHGKLTTSALPSSETMGQSLEFSPTLAAVVVVYDDQLHVIRSSGEDSHVKSPWNASTHQLVWSADGNEPYLAISGEGGDRQYHGFGQTDLAPLDKKPETYKWTLAPLPRKNWPIGLATQSTDAKRAGGTGSLKTLWLEIVGEKGKSTPGLVSGDVSTGVLSPTCDGVLYVTMDGAAFIRTVLPVDPKMVAQVRAQCRRATLLDNAKQIGMGLFMFACDNRDKLPPAAELDQKLSQYLGEKSAEILQLFQFTFSGDSLTDIEHRDTTVLGYLPGPDGVAVVYVDGHVRWVSSKP